MQENEKVIDEEKEKICENCARNLKVIRAYFGWRQGELAEKLGTTARRISEIETGKTKMSWTLFLALVSLFMLNPQKKDSPVYKMVIPEEAVQIMMEA